MCWPTPICNKNGLLFQTWTLNLCILGTPFLFAIAVVVSPFLLLILTQYLVDILLCAYALIFETDWPVWVLRISLCGYQNDLTHTSIHWSIIGYSHRFRGYIPLIIGCVHGFLHCLQLNGGYNPKPMVKSPADGAHHRITHRDCLIFFRYLKFHVWPTFFGYGPSLDKPKENVVDDILIYSIFILYPHSIIRYPYHFTQLLDFLSYVNVNKIPTYTMIFHIIYPMIFHRESPWSSHIISPRRYLHLVPLTHIHGFSYPLDDFRERAQAENQWALQVKDAGKTGHFGGRVTFFHIYIYYIHIQFLVLSLQEPSHHWGRVGKNDPTFAQFSRAAFKHMQELVVGMRVFKMDFTQMVPLVTDGCMRQDSHPPLKKWVV